MKSEAYTGKVRIRSCGLLFENDKILLVKLRSPVNNKLIWLPPGGGVSFGESLHTTVKREFKEETGLNISVEKLLHINEFIASEFHAVEFYFLVKKTGGKLALGTDPEHSEQGQILQNLRFFSEVEMTSISVTPDYLKREVWMHKKADFEITDIFLGNK